MSFYSLKVFVLTGLVSAVFVGCSKEEASQNPVVPVAPVEAPAPTAQLETSSAPVPAPASEVGPCDIIKQQLNDSVVHWQQEVQTVKIERHFQRVLRKDCSGNVASDKIETVKSPRGNIYLRTPDDIAFKSVFVFNETTCNSQLAAMPASEIPLLGALFGGLATVTGNGKNQVKVIGDMADAVLTFHVNKGINRFFAKYFYDCRPEKVEGNRTAVGPADCKESKDFSVGLHLINIEYEEKNLPGQLVLEAGNCNATKSQP